MEFQSHLTLRFATAVRAREDKEWWDILDNDQLREMALKQRSGMAPRCCGILRWTAVVLGGFTLQNGWHW